MGENRSTKYTTVYIFTHAPTERKKIIALGKRTSTIAVADTATAGIQSRQLSRLVRQGILEE
ncbi:MAG TPA: hypothetical protein VIC55_09980 [Gemmatimonadaceae bacterium]|jgi:hypothetical protein